MTRMHERHMEAKLDAVRNDIRWSLVKLSECESEIDDDDCEYSDTEYCVEPVEDDERVGCSKCEHRIRTWAFVQYDPGDVSDRICRDCFNSRDVMRPRVRQRLRETLSRLEEEWDWPS